MPDNWGDTAASLAALSAAASDAISAASRMSLPRHTAAARAPMNVSPHLKPEETRARGRGVRSRVAEAWTCWGVKGGQDCEATTVSSKE